MSRVRLSKCLVPAALCGALLVAGCDRQSAQQAQPGAQPSAASAAEPVGKIDRSHRGSRLPTLTLMDNAGAELHLPGLAGHPLLVNLWATWCAACVTELPTLNALAAQGAVRVIAVSEDTGRSDAVGAFLAAHYIDRLGAWLDADGALSGQYQANDLPMTIYYDASGREVWRFTGGNDWAGAGAAALLAEAGTR